MNYFRWSAGIVACAMLLSVNADAQLSKGPGRGPGGNPPSNPGQSGGPKSPPPPSKGDQNPPVRGNQGPPPPTKGDQNPPVRGNQGPPPPTKGDQNPPVRGNQGPPPPTKGDQNPPVRGNQGPPPPTKGDQNPPVRGNQGPPSGGGYGNGGTRGGDNPIIRGNGGTRGTDRDENVRSNSDSRNPADRLGKVRDARNTKGSYSGSINNGGPTKQAPQQIRNVPNSISLPSQVIREDDPRRRQNIYRSGYHHYDPYWRDDYFWCNNYIFDPWRVRCVVSPWYYYWSLPGYLSYNCIRIVNIPIYVWSGRRYNYSYNSGWGYGSYNNRGDLDYAIDDLRDAFLNMDRRALTRLIPRDGRVDIFASNRYDYSLDADEFYNLMLDGIYNADTKRYEIVSVETYRNEAEVVARHEFTDPWGRRSSVYHWYRMEESRKGYVITRFGTSDDNCWR